MKKILKRGLSFVLALIMVAGLLPVTAFAAVDSSGRPKDVNNTLILSIYTGTGFPGEPAVYGTGNYKNINSQFKVQSGATFASSAEGQLNWTEIEKDIVQGASSGNTSVWGVYNTTGLEKYFKQGATILTNEKEATIIRSVKNSTALNKASDEEVLSQYEIIWYVIKLQHNPGSGWFSRATTEWHIDGVIKEKQYYSINYYGNGNTSGDAPLGTTTHDSTKAYTVLGKNTLKKVMNGAEVAFLGWSARADGSGTELAFYQPGDVITAEELQNMGGKLSLYAMWDTTTQYTATVNTYLDGKLADEADIHGNARDLYLSSDKEHYYQLTRSSEGVYTTKITGNGKFHLYNKSGNTYTQIGDRQLTIYNQNGSMDIYHYSLAYDTNGGSFESTVDEQIYYYGDTATATAAVPTKDGHRFLGWMYKDNLILPGEEVTASVTEPMILTAQWEQTVTVTVNVTVNHKGGDGLDKVKDKDDVFLALVSRANDKSPYLEVQGKTLSLGKYTTVPEAQEVTQYIGNTFEDMPGGTVEYTVVTSKSGYDTEIESTQDADGNWIINVVMDYKPTNFDVDFTVQVDPRIVNLEKTTGKAYIPDAAIVKVTFWSTDRQAWEVITQQAGGAPGVRVDLNDDGFGSGSYPVWKYESGTNDPYLYRIEVTSFVYPDGTIVSAQTETENEVWTDAVYTATMDNNVGGMATGRANGDIDDELYAKLDKNLDGAYYSDANKDQAGTLHAVITMDLYNVTFKAQGGKVNGQDSQTVTNQYKIPSFKGYVPTRGDGYTFGGWYLDEECTEAAAEGTDLNADNTENGNITLYAKWIEPLTISGTVSIAGSYLQNGVKVPVNDIDRAMEAVVVLQEVRNGVAHEVDSKTVTFQYGEDNNAATDYSFTGIPNENKDYQIHILELNYGTTYDNEGDTDSVFTPNEYTAVFGGDNVADVDAQLTFVPPSYDQPMRVDATQINTGYKPRTVLAEVMYRDTGDNHPFKRISQHNVAPFGVLINFGAGREDEKSVWVGTGSQSIWKWHTDGTLYDYQMNISKVDGKDYDSDTDPFYIVYDAPAYWKASADAPSGELKATLIPKQYLVTYELNAGTDTVTGMDNFLLTYTDEEGKEVATGIYGVIHTWSFATDITAVPAREGYTFKGWQADVTGAYTNGMIGAGVYQDVVLTAQWEKITYEVTTMVTPNGGGTVTGAGTYDYGSEVTLTATAKPGYNFKGWKENGTLISNVTTLTIDKLTDNRSFVAEFSMDEYSVVAKADPEKGGTVTVSGDGTYTYGEKVTVTAAAEDGYTFVGWFIGPEGTKEVTNADSFEVTVTENLSYIAKFEAIQYEVTTIASPAEGGETSGDGFYRYGTEATVTATAMDGYTFVGWKENGTQVSETAEYTFTVKGDCTLTAEFVREYTVAVSATEGGTAAGNGTYNAGEIATVFATVEEGYKFMGWYENGSLVDSNAEYSFVVNGDRTLKASFAEAAHTITVTADPAEGGKVTGGGAYASKETATVTAVANDGYVFIGWYEDGKLAKEDANFSWSVWGDRTLTARFVKKSIYRSDFVYIFGYDDTQIGAEGPLLRGELAQMIYRLVKQNKPGTSNGGHLFSDTSGEWFQSGISYMASKGAIDRSKPNAYPYVAVTRGETYKMICLGLGFTDDASLRLSQYATILRNHGFTAPEGTVTGTIMRWQFCQLFNSILGRSHYEQLEQLLDTQNNPVTHETYNYTDLDPSKSYYKTMLIAASTFKDDKIDVAGRAQRNPLDEYGG